MVGTGDLPLGRSPNGSHLQGGKRARDPSLGSFPHPAHTATAGPPNGNFGVTKSPLEAKKKTWGWSGGNQATRAGWDPQGSGMSGTVNLVPGPAGCVSHSASTLAA